jgi:hypothetical protein
LIGTAPWGSAKSFTNFNTVCDIRVPRAQGEPVKKFGHQQNALAPEKIPKIRKKTRSMSGYLESVPEPAGEE